MNLISEFNITQERIGETLKPCRKNERWRQLLGKYLSVIFRIDVGGNMLLQQRKGLLISGLGQNLSKVHMEVRNGYNT